MSKHLYLAKEKKTILEKVAPIEFECLWNANLPYVDALNHKGRKGWSGVQVFQFEQKNLFIKKQQSYTKYSLSCPFGEPSFRYEKKMLLELDARGIKVPQVVFYDEAPLDGQLSSLLITKGLTHSLCLRSFLLSIKAGDIPDSERRAALKQMAETIRHLHSQGILHNALYPKHIFIQMTEDNRVDRYSRAAFIDLERTIFLKKPKQYLRDLNTLARRLQKQYSFTEALFFLKIYLGKNQIDTELLNVAQKIYNLKKF